MFLIPAFAVSGREPSRQTPTNIILIVSDSLRWDALGCNGGEARTPNLDRLASLGIRFDNAHSTAACTMPSAVAMFTGNYSSTYGLHRPQPGVNVNKSFIYHVPAAEKMLAEILTARGYDCSMSVENGLAMCSNNLQGFRMLGDLKSLSTSQVSRIEKTCGISNTGWDPDFNNSCRYDYLYSYLNAILSAPPDRPFYLLKWFFAPHIPYNAPGRFLERPAALAAALGKPLLPYTRVGYSRLPKLPENEKKTIMKALYTAAVESVDERVGFITRALQARNMMAQTLIIFTSDHGEYFGEHNLYGHEQAFFEPVLHVPLIMAGPGIPAGRRETSPVSLVDLMPTLCDLLGINRRKSMQGRSFAPLLRGLHLDGRPVYFDGLTNPQIEMKDDGLLQDNWKLIVNRQGTRPILSLYDLANDPAETHNRIGPSRRLQTMIKHLADIRRTNQQQLRWNVNRSRSDPNSASDWETQIRLMKSLGYIQE